MMSKLLLLLCFLFFLSFSQLFSSSFSFSNSTKLCPHHQAIALLHFKQSFSIDNSKSWKKGSDCCSWDGVTCDWVTGHVIELDLTGFGRFSSLTHLNLCDSEFSGPISPEISHLSNLLHLGGISISSIFPNGELPASIGNLKSLKILVLHNCGFSGSIPSSIGNLKNLISLGLASNNFSGQLPPSIGNLTNLQDLYFSDNFNMFNGTIPSWLYTMPSLVQYLFLSSNNFSGVLETSNFGKLRNLTSLDLSNNMLSLTTSDDSKSMLPYIESLDLSNNNISGIWSWNMGKNTLQYLNLSYNLISGGEILSLFCKASSMRILDLKLEVLDLGNNKINDTFPHWLGTLPELQVLVLRSNSFHGHIGCSKIKSPFMSLRIIDLAYNDFEGDLPEMYLRSLKATMNLLESLDLSSNKLIGSIPQELTSLTFLEVLNLSENHLTGFIPRGNHIFPINMVT
ncbi:unnamed protein product, partial [Vitis vinifera]